jgi:hypothetical protein
MKKRENASRRNGREKEEGHLYESWSWPEAAKAKYIRRPAYCESLGVPFLGRNELCTKADFGY